MELHEAGLVLDEFRQLRSTLHPAKRSDLSESGPQGAGSSHNAWCLLSLVTGPLVGQLTAEENRTRVSAMAANLDPAEGALHWEDEDSSLKTHQLGDMPARPH